jgi:hypothetical protein
MSPSRLLRLLAVLLFLCAICSASATQSRGGQAVIVRWQGINYPAHVISSEGGRYRIRYDEHREGRPDEEWVGVDRLKNSDYSLFRPAGGGGAGRAAGASGAASATADMPRAVPAGRYACFMYISGTGLVSNGEFTLYPNGTYERGGARGRYTYAAGTGRVTFQGGVMNGRAARYEARAVPTLHLMGNAGHVLAAGEERPVASCERK